MTPPAPRDWWRHYFDDAYFQLHDPHFPEVESRREVAGMIELLGLPVGARILDAPAGWGRHAVLLAEAGYQVVAADLSLDMLRRAPQDGPPRVAADVRSLPFADACFDAVLNVFTSLGLFLDDAEDLHALREARRVLGADGTFLFESMHRDEVVAHYAERDRWSLPDGTEVRASRRFDAIRGISHEVMEWRGAAGRGRKRNALRLRTATEIDGLLREAGFADVRYYGDWNGARFHRRAERLIAVARRE